MAKTEIISGVYIITNTKNNKHYIGESISLHRRLLSHKNDLKNNRHNNQHLQNAFNKDGAECFVFDLLDECLPQNCQAMEHYWCNLLNTHNDKFGYNIRLTTTENKVGKHSEESKKKLSIAHTGKKISDEHRKNMSLAQKRRDNTGGQYRSNKAKEIISIANKLREKPVLQYMYDGSFIKEWPSRKHASNETGIGYSAICNSTVGNKPKTAGGFRWQLKNIK